MKRMLSESELVDLISECLCHPLHSEYSELGCGSIFMPIGMSSYTGSLFQLIVLNTDASGYTVELVDICGRTVKSERINSIDILARQEQSLKLAYKWLSEFDQIQYYREFISDKVERLERLVKAGKSVLKVLDVKVKNG